MTRIYGHNLRETEADILDLWDAGRGSVAIAATLDLRERYVLDVLSRFESRDDWQDSARSGSRNLIAAIIASGGAFA